VKQKTPLKWGSYWMVMGILGLSGDKVMDYCGIG